MKLLLLNVDPSRGDCPPSVIAETGASGVRLVLRPGLEDACAGYRTAGLDVLGVIARESFKDGESWAQGADRMARDFGGKITMFQRGNEQDLTSVSSWTMAPLEYARFCWAMEPLQPSIHGGLASGDPSYVTRMFQGNPNGVPDLPWALHPYDTAGQSIHHWLQMYRQTGAYRFWLTEAWPNEHQTRQAFAEALDVEAIAWWWHDPIGTGQLQIKGNPDRIAAFQRLAAEIGTPGGEVPPMPAPVFMFGFKDYADAHPEVGKALSSERYFAPDLSCQLAENGLLVYAQETNRVVYIASKS